MFGCILRLTVIMNVMRIYINPFVHRNIQEFDIECGIETALNDT